MSSSGIVFGFDSYSDVDKFLIQYRGYTSRAMQLGLTKIKSKNGKEYFVKSGE